MTVDTSWLAPVIVVTGLTVWVAALLVATSDNHVEHHGRDSRRARRALSRHLRSLADVADDQVVPWLDHAALTKREIVEVLGEHGWYLRGQDMDVDGWPLYVGRGPGSADARHQVSRPGRWDTVDGDRPPGVDGSAHVRTTDVQEGPRWP